MHPRPFALLDWFALGLSAAALAASLVLTASSGGPEPVVLVEASGRSWAYPLSARVELDIPGPLGLTHVHIEEGAAWVSDSPCREKICVTTGRITRPGAWIACLPNRVFVRVEGRASSEVDRVAF